MGIGGGYTISKKELFLCDEREFKNECGKGLCQYYKKEYGQPGKSE
jgi:hypothetical protein